VTFRTRLFVASLITAAVTIALATLLVSWSVRRGLDERIERTLLEEARLAAATLAHRQPATLAELDAEADALGRLIDSRVTFIAPDGTVVGDSEVDADDLAGVENHGSRPEVVQARREGLGVARRYSTTVQHEMLYVAVPVTNSAIPNLAQVRLSLPLTDIGDQLAAVRRSALVASAAGLAAALVMGWIASALLSRRVRTIAAVAERYSTGDLSAASRDYGDDEIGTVARALDAAVHDVARHAAELDADRARMEAILGGMIEGVVVVNDQGRLALVNAAARRMLRLHGPSSGQHYLEIVRHPDVAAQIGGALRGEILDAGELTLASDPDRAFIARTARIAGRDRHGAVLVLHDITDLRRADRIRRDFVANVSHELRTPLTAVRGYVEALLEDGGDAAQAKQFLEIISRHTLRMERLVRDLLRLARLEAGQDTIEQVPCSVDALFTSAETELASQIAARHQRIEHRIDARAATVIGDPAKLHDVLRNLLENAANHAPDGSRIVLAAARHGDHIALTVADDGPGIPELELTRVFERFYRVDKARSRSGGDPGGTGLGLAIVKHLVELHGGRVTAANRPEGGALVTVTIPAEAPDAGPSRPDARATNEPRATRTT
jgi:two-component system phosphate regulon sensor histidine kinase PhoR